MPRPLALRYVFFLKPSRANDGTFVMATDTADSAFVLAGPNAEAHTVGDDRDEPLQRAPYALATVIDAYIRARRPLPAPSKERTAVGLPPLMSVKLDLYNAMQAAGITKSELARRLDVHLPQVDRLLDLGHNSRIDQLEAAAEAVGATRVSRCSRAAARCSCRWRRPSSRSALECSADKLGTPPDRRRLPAGRHAGSFAAIPRADPPSIARVAISIACRASQRTSDRRTNGRAPWWRVRRAPGPRAVGPAAFWTVVSNNLESHLTSQA